jgi:hypothetical protein
MADKNVKHLSYCDKCDPAFGLAVGRTVVSARHTVDGKVHEGVTVEIEDAERIASGETPGAFLARMVKKYAK